MTTDAKMTRQQAEAAIEQAQKEYDILKPYWPDGGTKEEARAAFHAANPEVEGIDGEKRKEFVVNVEWTLTYGASTGVEAFNEEDARKRVEAMLEDSSPLVEYHDWMGELTEADARIVCVESFLPEQDAA